MAQSEIQVTTTPPLPGTQLVAEINDALETIATDFSGSIDPAANAFAYSLWADTGTGDLKRRNAANSAWTTIGRIYPAVTEDASGNVTFPGTVSVGGGLLSPQTGFKNRIINGNFGINQRVVSGTVTLAAGVYGHDRWKAGASGCTYTFATVDNVTTLTISAGSLIQVIEGLNLQSGTYTLSWTGTAQGKIGAGSYGSTGITGTAVGGTNLNIEFNTGTVSLVQLEKGSTATPFEFRSYGQELALCQRYYATGRIVGEAYFANVSSNAADFFIASQRPPVNMRAAPTIVLTPNTSGTYVLFVGTSECIAVKRTGTFDVPTDATYTASSEL